MNARRNLIRNPLVDSLRDVVGVESWAAETYPDGADADGTENPDRRDQYGDPPATYDDSEPDNHDHVGQAPADVVQLDRPEPEAEARPLRSVMRQVQCGDEAGGKLLLARDPLRHSATVKVTSANDVLLAPDAQPLFSSTSASAFLLESTDGLLTLDGGAELWARGSGGTAVVYVCELFYAVGTIVPDAEHPAR